MGAVKSIIIAFMVCCLSVTPAALAKEFIYTNKPTSLDDKRYEYPHRLLEKVLDVTAADNSEFLISFSDDVMTRERMLLSLKLGKDLHVVAEATKPDWVEELLVIRIPIRKGIQGYRLFLINEQDIDIFSNIRSLDDLRGIPTGSAIGWSTTRVMCETGFNIVTASRYDSLFEMLKRRRFKTFNRGINEIKSEYEAQKVSNPHLAIEPNLALYVPLPTYFFVSPHKPELAKRIEEGLRILMDSGEFDRFFHTYHHDILTSFSLENRTIFALSNPNLDDEDPLDKEDLWFRLDSRI